MAMRDEIHINGDVAWMLGQAGALALIPQATANKAAKDAADFFYSRAQFPEELYIVLNNVVSPDESHTGNNDLHTNLLAQWCANGGTWNPKPYDGHPLTNPPPPTYKLPRDSAGFLTYDNDGGGVDINETQHITVVGNKLINDTLELRNMLRSDGNWHLNDVSIFGNTFVNSYVNTSQAGERFTEGTGKQWDIKIDGNAYSNPNGDPLFLDPSDKHSVWTYSQDGQNVAKVANSFPAFIKPKRAKKPTKKAVELKAAA